MKVTNIFQTRSNENIDAEKAPTIKNWLGREGMLFIKTLTGAVEEMCEFIKD